MGSKEQAIKNLSKIEPGKGGKKSRKKKVSLKRAIEGMLHREGAGNTLTWIKTQYPEKYIDILRDMLKGEIQSSIRIKVEGEVEHVLNPGDRELFRRLSEIYAKGQLELPEVVDNDND